jgi:hypothetical protein
MFQLTLKYNIIFTFPLSSEIIDFFSALALIGFVNGYFPDASSLSVMTYTL